MALLSAMLAGISQIYFVNHLLAGLLMLLAVAWVSPWMALLMVLAVAAATLLACWRRWEPAAWRDGLFGFNAALVGLAIGLFAPPGPAWLALAILGGALSAAIYAGLRRLAGIPWYTLPFNLLVLPALYLYGSRLIEVPEGHQFALSAVGQVVFLPDSFSALLICAALLLAGAGLLAWAVIGGVVASLVAWGLGVGTDVITFGLAGYNGVLAAIGLYWHRLPVAWILAGVTAAGLMSGLMLRLGLPMLTLPFVLSCWLCLALRRGICYQGNKRIQDREKT
jgi:urea transporter